MATCIYMLSGRWNRMEWKWQNKLCIISSSSLSIFIYGCYITQIITLSTLYKHVTSMSSAPEPAVWSCDTGRPIPCFDSCQLILTWMTNTKDVSWCSPQNKGCIPWSTFISGVSGMRIQTPLPFPRVCKHVWPAGRSAGQSASWSVGRLVGRPAGWSVGRSASRPVGWLYADFITKFSWFDGFTEISYLWCSAGTLCMAELHHKFVLNAHLNISSWKRMPLSLD